MSSLRFFFFLVFIAFAPNIALSNNYIFIKNEGQWNKNILFKADIPSGFLWISTQGLVYQLFDPTRFIHPVSNSNSRISFKPDETIKYAFKEQLSFSKIKTSKKVGQKYNYYLGNDPSLWASNVSAFEEIYIEDVFENIDFKLYSSGESLKYEYIVKPNGHPENIKIKYDGQKQLKILNKELHLFSSFGLIKEFEPFTYQEKNGSKIKIPTAFQLENEQVTFKVSKYDATKPLIIDPELVFSTYSGSVSDNWSHTATYDLNGNLYAAGTVFGANYPVIGDIFQPSAAGVTKPLDEFSKTDIVITKYAADGKTILYSTFLGGEGSEVPHSLIVNSKNELVVYGTTSSSNFPTTFNAISRIFNGGVTLTGGPITTNIGFINGTDIFVTVISENGSKLNGSTYIGGSGNDGINDYRQLSITNYGDEFRGEVYVGPNDNIYVASVTNSNNFPKVNSTSIRNSATDAVVFQLNNDCSKILYSTYLGGGDYDAAFGIRVDDKGVIYVCGVTRSKDFYVSTNAFKKTIGGDMDGFIVKIENFIITASSYIGTSAGDLVLLLDLDPEKNIVLFGLTNGEYPIVGLVYNNAKSGQFIHSINNDLSATNFSSVFGTGRQVGRIDIVPTAFLVNKCGNIYVAGWGGRVNSRNGFNSSSTTTGLPITSNAFQNTTTGNNYYFAIFEKGFKSLLYGTYFGSKSPPNPNDERGDHLDGGTCRFDKNGIIYHSACVCKGNGFIDFPLKNAVQSNHNNNNCNMAAFKFDLDALSAKFDLVNGATKNPINICAPEKITLDNSSLGGESFEWFLNNQLISRTKNVDYNFTQSGTFVVKLKAYSKIACSAVDSTQRTITVKAIAAKVSNDTIVCAGSTVKLFAEGGSSYQWTSNTPIDNSTLSKIEIVTDIDRTYSVDIKKEECSIKKEIKIKVENNKTDFGASNNVGICPGESTKLNASGLATSFVWSALNMVDSTQKSIIVKPFQTTTYTVRAIYPDGCKPLKNIIVNVDNSLKLDFGFTYRLDCNKPSEIVFENLSIGGKRYFWNLDGKAQEETITPKNITLLENKQTFVTLSGISELGCSSSIIKNVNLNYYDGFIPNVITPNGDNKNDNFVIGFPEPKLEIYNQWGKKIFEDEKYNNNWGSKIAGGTYYYLITLNNNKTCKGYIEVIN